MGSTNGYIDITESGPLTHKELQQENQSVFEGMLDPAQYLSYENFIYEGPEMSPIQQTGTGDYLGNSRWDKESYTQAEWNKLYQNPNEFRAQNQPWYSKLGAGVGKGAALAFTTFIDSTAGLVFGIGEGAEALISGEGGRAAVSRLWNNSLSTAVREMNQEMEYILPNYRTQEEIDKSWYRNLGTMNFWADSFIKNLGFTIGAFYSGKAWTSALKAAGVLKSAASAQVIGSVMSGLNEARIEANNNSYDFLNAQRELLKQGYDQALQEINNDPSYLTQADRNIEIAKLNERYTQLDQRAQEEADRMGLAVLIGNTAILTASNMWQFGKLYSRGFDNAKGIMGSIQMGIEREGITGGVKEGGKYAVEQMTKGQIYRRALSNGLAEGFEEMNQALIAEHAGLYRSSDDPDAYYKALTDPKYQYETRDWTNSLTEAFSNTYGTGQRWEEFTVGALTGLIGMPTFGRVNNADANTWLGKGKAFGISGGLIGEVRSQNAINAERQSTVDAMNKFVDNMNQQIGHMAQSNYFTDVMDGYAADKNQFEWTNARDNDMFAGFSAFRKANRLDEFREIINQDFENLTDDKLQQIALNTTPAVELNEDGTAKRTDAQGNILTAGWRDKKTGQLLSETEEGRQQMRQELTEKRNRIAKALDSYEKTLETVRGISNNALSDDETNELAWLKWKQGIFKDRFSDIKSKEDPFIKSLSDAIDKFIYRQSGQLLVDENNERIAQGKKRLGGKAAAKYAPRTMANGEQVLNNMEVVKEYLEAIQRAESPTMLAALLQNNPEIIKYIENLNPDYFKEYFDVDIDSFNASITDLSDMAKISNAYKRFSERYEEFTKDPLKLRQNRDKIDKDNQKAQEATTKIRQEEALKDMSVSDMVKQADNGELDLDLPDLDSMSGDVVAKVEEAKALQNTKNNLVAKIDASDAPEDVKQAALSMVNSNEADSVEDFINLDGASYNDPTILDIDQSSIASFSAEEVESYMDNLMGEAKSLISQSLSSLEKDAEEVADIKKNTIGRFEREEKPEEEIVEDVTGHDEVDKGKTVNEERKEQHEKQQEVATDATNPMNRFNVVNKWMTYIDKHSATPITGVQRDALEQALLNVVGQVNTLYKAGNNVGNIIKVLSDTREYKIANSIFPIDPLIENYFKGITDYLIENEEKLTPADKVEQPQDVIPEVTDTEVNNEISLSPTRQEYKPLTPRPYAFWRTTSTQLPINRQLFNNTEFWKQAEALGYKGEQLQRIKAIGEFFEKNRVFDRVNNGEVQKGDKIGFRILKDLNDKAGSVVILITDKNGNIVGDMPAITDSTVKDYIGLEDFLQSLLKDYEQAGSPEVWNSDKTSIVDKNMIGKVPYSKTRNTLNKVFGNTPFKLGIAMKEGLSAILGTPGITKQDTDPIKNVTLPALKASMGQPYLLLTTSDKTGNNQYIPVPFLMDKYNQNMIGSTFDKVITDLLSKLFSANNKTVMPVINDLKEFFALPELHVNYDNEGKMTIHIQTANMERQVPIFTPAFYNQWNGDVNTAVNSIKQALFKAQVPIQVSRKYINTNYGQYDYNRIIGELATVNLDEGSTHTISDWFTIAMLDENGNIVKESKSPKSIGMNPSSKPREEKPIVNPTKTSTIIGSFTKPANTTQSPEEILTAAGVLNTPVAKSAWNKLTSEQQQILAGKSVAEQRQLMPAIVATMAMGGDVNSLLGNTRFSIAEGVKESFDLDKELEWLNKVLPQFSLDEEKQLVKGLQHAGLDLYGMFKDGLIYLNSTNQTRGTTYHEAFHAVFLTLLTDKERADIIKEAKQKFGNLEGIALEEKLAEDFREYTQYVEYSESPFKKFWRKLKRMIQHLFGKNAILNALYYDINEGKYRDRIPNIANDTRYKAISNLTTEERQMLNKLTDAKEALLKTSEFKINFTDMTIEYNSKVPDAINVKIKIEEAIQKELGKEVKVYAKVSDNPYYANIEDIEIDGNSMVKNMENVDTLITIRENSKAYDVNKTVDQILSEQALIDQEDTFDFNARYRVAVDNHYNNLENQSESTKKEWSDIGGTEEDFSAENYEIKDHCGY